MSGLGPAFRPELVEHADFTTEGGAVATARLMDRAPDVDALFIASDLMALGALGTLRRLGRRVPDDVAIVGFDDLPEAMVTFPFLTVVAQPAYQIGTCLLYTSDAAAE